LERDELHHLAAALGKLLDNDELDEMMEALDTNSDNKVSLEEFSIWYRA
jgi:Ca2+-binding EF-hand superfamily protein